MPVEVRGQSFQPSSRIRLQQASHQQLVGNSSSRIGCQESVLTTPEQAFEEFLVNCDPRLRNAPVFSGRAHVYEDLGPFAKAQQS
jgi:hypothetical protein